VTDILSIGASGVSAYQRALGGVSNNISNLSTPGYSRQVTEFSADAPQRVGNLFIGTGVSVQGVQRLYDQFSEGALRTAYSNAGVQGPLVDYTNRVIDAIGNGSTSLSSALNQFFSSAQAAAGDPASMDLRNKLLTDTGGLASRFRLVAGQLAGIESDSKGQINSDLQQLNGYSKQLAAVNRQLQGESLESSQPPALLDQRDQLLRDMSKLCSLKTTFSVDGQVAVAIAGANQVNIVEGTTVRDVSAQFSDNSAGKVDLIIDQYGSPSGINGTPGGEIGGLLSFRQQVLEPTQSGLDALATTIVAQVNEINTNGVDLKGHIGGNLLQIDPVYTVEAPTTLNPPTVSTTVVDESKFVFHDLQLNYDAKAGLWNATDRVTGQIASGGRSITINGMRLDIFGAATDAESVTLKAVNHPAGGVSLRQTDPGAIAAAALFRVTGSNSNSGAMTASVAYDKSSQNGRPPPVISDVLVNNPNPQAGVTITNTQSAWYSAIAKIPPGYTDVKLYLNNPSSGGQDLQIFTRDGRQIAGEPLSTDQASQLLTEQNGFNSGTTYSTQYLNKAGAAGYRGLDVVYGARAVPERAPVFNDSSDVTNQAITGYRNLPARLQGTSIADITGQPGDTAFAAGALSINGNALPALAIPSKGYVSAQDVAQWLNSVADKSGVVASAQNVVSISADKLALPTMAASTVSINGVSISAPCSNLGQLVDALNQQSSATHVVAFIGASGDLALKNDDANAGADITIGATASSQLNVFKNAIGTYHGQLALTSAGEIDVTGTDGRATSDLTRLGFQAGAWVSGPLDEDLLVFKTGVGSARVSATYTAGSTDQLAALRGETMQIAFTDAQHYNITDTANGSVIASRLYDPAAVIKIGPRTVHLSGVPAAGDLFNVDGNLDGTGDNTNLLDLVALQDKKLTSDGRTIGDAYSGMVSRVGDVATQAQASQQALDAIKQQAEKKRDSTSGVNLDTEAADLIRFQQAYQAAARSMQVASQLFDVLTQIHQ